MVGQNVMGLRARFESRAFRDLVILIPQLVNSELIEYYSNSCIILLNGISVASGTPVKQSGARLAVVPSGLHCL